MHVIRPANPERAIELVREVGLGNSAQTQTRWDAVHQKLNDECGPYTFVGYMGKPLKCTGPLAKHKARKQPVPVVDVDGNQVDVCKPGDSFVGPDFFEGVEIERPN